MPPSLHCLPIMLAACPAWPYLTSVQVYSKKQKDPNKPPSKNHSVKVVAVATSYATPKEHWINAITGFKKSKFAEGLKLAKLHSRPELATPAAAKEYVERALDNGEVPREMIGKNGKPGPMYPPQADYDLLHKQVIGQGHFLAAASHAHACPALPLLCLWPMLCLACCPRLVCVLTCADMRCRPQ